MDTDNDNATEQPTGDVQSRVNEPVVNPLRRVFVPIEKRMADGNFRLRTTDRTRYTRNAHTGTIFRADPKPLNKHARRREQAAQRQERANAISN